MAYVTIAQLNTHYGAREVLQLSDKSNAKTLDAARVQSAIDRAAALIDTALSRCYALPLAMADGSALAPHIAATLEEWNGRIARYLLTDDVRPLNEDAQMSAAEVRYRDVRRTLAEMGPGLKGGCVYFNGLIGASQPALESAVEFGDEGSFFGRTDRAFPGAQRLVPDSPRDTNVGTGDGDDFEFERTDW